MTGHNIPLIVLTVLAPVIFAGTLIFNSVLMAIDDELQRDIGNTSDKYYLEITPASWTFSIWGFIYAWQVIWMVYTLVNLFRKTDQGPLYANPVLLSVVFYVCYILNVMLNSAWSYVFTKEILPVALVFLVLSTACLYVCLFTSHKALVDNQDTVIKQGRTHDVWMTRVFIHNGIGIYGTWSTIATLLNLAIVVAYRGNGVSQQNASSISLAILSVVILVFLFADWVILDRFTRYTFTPYIVLVVAFIGSIAKNYDEGARNTVFTIVLLSVSVAAMLVKCFLTIWRHRYEASKNVLITENELKA